jgi:hypothetical protein
MLRTGKIIESSDQMNEKQWNIVLTVLFITC